jgi:hypothetical protein
VEAVEVMVEEVMENVEAEVVTKEVGMAEGAEVEVVTVEEVIEDVEVEVVTIEEVMEEEVMENVVAEVATVEVATVEEVTVEEVMVEEVTVEEVTEEEVMVEEVMVEEVTEEEVTEEEVMVEEVMVEEVQSSVVAGPGRQWHRYCWAREIPLAGWCLSSGISAGHSRLGGRWCCSRCRASGRCRLGSSSSSSSRKSGWQNKHRMHQPVMIGNTPDEFVMHPSWQQAHQHRTVKQRSNSNKLKQPAPLETSLGLELARAAGASRAGDQQYRREQCDELLVACSTLSTALHLARIQTAIQVQMPQS